MGLAIVIALLVAVILSYRRFARLADAGQLVVYADYPDLIVSSLWELFIPLGFRFEQDSTALAVIFWALAAYCLWHLGRGAFVRNSGRMRWWALAARLEVSLLSTLLILLVLEVAGKSLGLDKEGNDPFRAVKYAVLVGLAAWIHKKVFARVVGVRVPVAEIVSNDLTTLP